MTNVQKYLNRKEQGGFELLFVILLTILAFIAIISGLVYEENSFTNTAVSNLQTQTAQQGEQVFVACTKTPTKQVYSIAQLISAGLLPSGYPPSTPVGNAWVCDNAGNNVYVVTWDGFPTNIPNTSNATIVTNATVQASFAQSIASIMQAALASMANTSVGVVPANSTTMNVVNQNYTVSLSGILTPVGYPEPVVESGLYHSGTGTMATGGLSPTALTSTSGGLAFPNGSSTFTTPNGNIINSNGTVTLSNGQTVKGTTLGNAITYVNATGNTVNYTFSSLLSGGYTRVVELGTTQSFSCSAGPWGGSQACAAGSIGSLGAQWIWGSPDGATGTNQSGYYVMANQYNNTTGSPITATLTFTADNLGWVWLNGQQVSGVSSNWTTTTSSTITLPTGVNNISFLVLNEPDGVANPASGILAINQGSKALLVSNSKWWYTSAPPTAPNPPMTNYVTTPYNCSLGGC